MKFTFGIVTLIFLSIAFILWSNVSQLPPVRIGIIHASSGNMAFSEKPLIQVLLMEIDSVNKNDGLLGRIGKVLPSGKFKVVWSSRNAIRPVPYPSYQSKDSWNAVIKQITSELPVESGTP